MGKKGGSTQPDEVCLPLVTAVIILTIMLQVYKPSEHDGLKQDGTPDKRMSSEHGFGGDRQFASEMGKKGYVS